MRFTGSPPPPETGHGRQIPVDSETVRSIDYDACSRVLRVAFGSGGTYEYVGVPLQLYEARLMPHPWRRVGRLVRAHGYRRIAA